MEIRQLRYFVLAAQEENFNRAAQRLHISQPALSRRIRDLESELGVALFERDHKRVHLTAAGRCLCEDALAILRNIDHAALKCRHVSSGQAGELKIAFPESVVRHGVVAAAFREFRSRHPLVNLQLTTMAPSSGTEAVRKGEVDAAFVYRGPEGDAGLLRLEIAVDEWLLAVPPSHPLARKPTVCLADLENEPFVWTRRDVDAGMHDRLLGACHAGGLRPRIIQHTVNESTRLSLVTAGMGVTFVISSIDSATAVIRKVADLSVPLHVELIRQRRAGSPQVARFTALVEELLATHPEPSHSRYAGAAAEAVGCTGHTSLPIETP